MNVKLQTLTKPNWRVSDIANYVGCSKSTAQRIKNDVAKKYGVCELATDAKRTSVKGDDVIKFLGGINRFEEMAILINLKHKEE